MLNSEVYTELRIATGYWDLPGTRLIYKELDAFFARGGKLELLIGQEPQLRAYQMRSDLSAEEKFRTSTSSVMSMSSPQIIKTLFALFFSMPRLRTRRIPNSKSVYSAKTLMRSASFTPNAISSPAHALVME